MPTATPAATTPAMRRPHTDPMIAPPIISGMVELSVNGCLGQPRRQCFGPAQKRRLSPLWQCGGSAIGGAELSMIGCSGQPRRQCSGPAQKRRLNPLWQGSGLALGGAELPDNRGGSERTIRSSRRPPRQPSSYPPGRSRGGYPGFNEDAAPTIQGDAPMNSGMVELSMIGCLGQPRRQCSGPAQKRRLNPLWQGSGLAMDGTELPENSGGSGRRIRSSTQPPGQPSSYPAKHPRGGYPGFDEDAAPTAGEDAPMNSGMSELSMIGCLGQPRRQCSGPAQKRRLNPLWQGSGLTMGGV